MAMPSSNIGMIDASCVDDGTNAKSVLLREAKRYRDAAESNHRIAHRHQLDVAKLLADAEKCERLAQDIEAAAGKLA